MLMRFELCCKKPALFPLPPLEKLQQSLNIPSKCSNRLCSTQIHRIMSSRQVLVCPRPRPHPHPRLTLTLPQAGDDNEYDREEVASMKVRLPLPLNSQRVP